MLVRRFVTAAAAAGIDRRAGAAVQVSEHQSNVRETEAEQRDNLGNLGVFVNTSKAERGIIDIGSEARDNNPSLPSLPSK